MKKALLTYENQKGLYQNKVTFSLTSTQRQGHQAHNCKMDYYAVTPELTRVRFPQNPIHYALLLGFWSSIVLAFVSVLRTVLHN